MDDLPLVGHDEGAIHVPDNKPHWRVGFIARGGVDVGVSLAVFKPRGWPVGRFWGARMVNWEGGVEETCHCECHACPVPSTYWD